MMVRPSPLPWFLLSFSFLLATGCGQGEPAEAPNTATRSLAAALGGPPPEGFRRALPPAEIRLPQDHGAHPDFRTEWWYFTGHLESNAGAPLRFGYQLTFFRTALAPPAEEHPGGAQSTPWAADQMYMAHFAVTEIDGPGGGRFHHFERFGRGSMGLAGVETSPFGVWLGPWSAATVATGEGADIWPLQLRAADRGEAADKITDPVALDLRLEPRKEPVLQGEAGYSRKGPDPGDASYYYSYTRLATEGTLQLGDRQIAVTGSSWLDREWSTSVLGEEQVGWDWFALQLDGDEGEAGELMLFQLRKADGLPDRWSAGKWVPAEGESHTLYPEDFTLEVLDRWSAPDGRATYPSRWQLQLHRDELEGLPRSLQVEAAVADQELHAAVRYWEGAVTVTGDAAGRGYVEMTGYARSTAATMGR